ncbi:MAG: YlbF family regulator [Ruminococcus sp.]|nr:YlbF family regulator [Ruminococcus sp.]
MSAIDAARALGTAIQQDERYIKFQEVSKASDTDTALQNKIGEFNTLRMELSSEMRKEDKDADKMTSLDNEIKELYDEIMAMPTMTAYNDAKAELDDLLSSINFIISMAANGEDPMTCPDHAPAGCSGSCSSCAGCH